MIPTVHFRNHSLLFEYICSSPVLPDLAHVKLPFFISHCHHSEMDTHMVSCIFSTSWSAGCDVWIKQITVVWLSKSLAWLPQQTCWCNWYFTLEVLFLTYVYRGNSFWEHVINLQQALLPLRIVGTKYGGRGILSISNLERHSCWPARVLGTCVLPACCAVCEMYAGGRWGARTAHCCLRSCLGGFAARSIPSTEGDSWHLQG